MRTFWIVFGWFCFLCLSLLGAEGGLPKHGDLYVP